MTENTVQAFRQAGCEVGYFPVNGNNRLHELYYKWRGKLAGNNALILAESLRNKINAFVPDLIVFVLGAWQPELIYQTARTTRPQALCAAWVGDVINPAESIFAHYMDWIFCTDSYFIESLKNYGASTPASYLPLAMDPQHFYPGNLPRSNKIVYVAKYSPGRATFISQVQRPLSLYGKRWNRLDAPQHEIHPHHFSLKKLPDLYSSSCAVLNLKNELNVVHGINQRSFEPYGCKTPVINDAVPDISLCFDPGKEILVYHSLDELHDLHDKITGDPNFARSIGDAGYRRVMAEHTYAHRARSMLQQLGLSH
jgi:spore maturation protein CgeB